MDWNLKKMWPAAAASLVAFTSLLNAVDDAQMRNLENRVTALEQRKATNGGMINPPANPKVKNGWDIFITAEALYWRASENGLGYAIEAEHSDRPAVCNSSSFPVDGDVQNPSRRYDWGFRVGLGYVMPHDNWDISLTYTWFESRRRDCDDDCDDCCHQCGTEVFYPTFYTPCKQPVCCPYVTDACGKWRLKLDMLDLELGREFFVSKWLTLRPHVGLRGAFIHQDYDIEYEGGTYVPTNHEFELDMDQKFRGGGIRAGLNTQWDLTKDWAFYGNFALSVLLGNLKVHEREEDENKLTDTETLRFKVHDHYIICRPVTDLQLGIQWDHGFADDAFHLTINVGWEHHYFWGQNQFLKFINPDVSGAYVANQGDLSIAGWVGGIRMDF